MFTEGVRSLITHMVSVGTGVWLAYRYFSALANLVYNLVYNKLANLVDKKLVIMVL